MTAALRPHLRAAHCLPSPPLTLHPGRPSKAVTRKCPGSPRLAIWQFRATPATTPFRPYTGQYAGITQLRSSWGNTSFALALFGVVICLPAYFGGQLLNPEPEERRAISGIEHAAADMATELLPGRPGNLTEEEEEKLRKLWSLILKLCGVGDEEAVPPGDGSGSTTPSVQKQTSLKVEATKPKKKRLSMFSRKGAKAADTDSETSATPSSVAASIKEGDHDDKYGQTKQFFDALASQSPESLRETLWGMVKHDHPDALVLRFLRARKWDVDKALVMLISTMNWRATEVHVDDDIMNSGEGGAAEAEIGEDGQAKTLARDFLTQVRMGKSFLHGVDKNGRPICVVRVRLHKQGDQCEQSLERYTVYIIETARLVLKPPVDTAVSSSRFS